MALQESIEMCDVCSRPENAPWKLVIVVSLKFIGTLGEYFQDRDSSADMNKVFVLLHLEFPNIVFNTWNIISLNHSLTLKAWFLL